MAIYECKVRGEDKVRLVKASTGAQARDHIVEATAINAERMAELIESGVKLEKVGDPTDPSSHAPGGALHNGGGEGEEGGDGKS